MDDIYWYCKNCDKAVMVRHERVQHGDILECPECGAYTTFAFSYAELLPVSPDAD